MLREATPRAEAPYRAAGADFLARADAHRESADRLERRSRGYSAARLTTFLAASVSGLLGLDGAPLAWRPWLLAFSGATGLYFLFLVVRHQRLRKVLERETASARINTEHELRRGRRWAALEEVPVPRAPEAPPAFATDLDLWGHASLFRLLGPTYTAPGQATLRGRLLAAGFAEAIAARQAAVREVAGLPDLSDAVASRASLLDPVDPTTVTRFRRWAEGGDEGPDPEVARPLGVPGLTLALPALNTGVTVAVFAFGISWIWLAPSLALSAWVARRSRRATARTFSEAASGERGVGRYGEVLEPLTEASFESPLARTRIAEPLAAGGAPATEALRRLSRLLVLSEARLSSLHFLLDLFFLWDLQVARGLERWRVAYGAAVGGWLEALGEFEALQAAAFLARAHPGWSYPRVDADRSRLRARALGHPLLPPDRCVCNDVELPEPGRFLLVTGSNMAGKSTLLRAVGTNVLLARTGAPVCATELTMPPLRVETAMRIRDDLEAGLSTFMAELERLRAVVEEARTTSTDSPQLLYLLDEILQGTNSSERRIAARTILRHLLETPAIGAVTTHDLSLADAPDLRDRAVDVHFREEVISREEGMRFDYRIRDGVAPTTNALKLLEVLGLAGTGADEEEASPDLPGVSSPPS